MAKTRAEIQKAYRERKKLCLGNKCYIKRDQRVKKYCQPFSSLTDTEKQIRREVNRRCNIKFRQRKREREELEKAEHNLSTTESGNSHITKKRGRPKATPAFIVNLPFRRRRGALANAKKTIEALKTENENLQRKVWRTEKRYRRQELSTGSSNESPSSSISHRPEEMRNEGLTPPPPPPEGIHL